MHKVFLCLLVAVIGTAAPAADWPVWGGELHRNMVNHTEKGMPTKLAAKDNPELKWVAQLGSQSYGNPVISDGKIFVGTNNQAELDPKIKGDKGVIMAFRESDGAFLWQMVHDKLKAGRVNDWPLQGVCSTPHVVGKRLYYVNNRCELICADVEGLANGNDGPYKNETYKGDKHGDIIWSYDMMEELGVFPHNLATSSPLVKDGLVFLVTGNGVDEGHLNLPSPISPSFIAVDAETGKLVWEYGELEKVLHGQWSSPAYAVIKGKPQVIFPGGDGWVYSLEPKSGKLIWKFDCNPKDSVWELGGTGTRNNLISTPVVHEDQVIIGVGQDPEHGSGIGHFYAIDATKTGDITKTGAKWHYGGKEFGRTMSTASIHDGLIYISELDGILHAVDFKTGKQVWKHDLFAAVWGSTMVVDGKIYIGDEDGDICILQAGRTPKVLGEFNLGSAVYTTPSPANGVLYIASRSKLFAFKAGK
ncbi:PQQ-binding-like beta-propeller repeat protein [Sulfidibacter corallicola]|uniref:PQQ-binding-like beta-propeller repeat protein n=1 Tax=Sulfidibacter corallicola TaxID=2818388 RepID=A0A8A4TPP8_SULCO|nr:PQQ-like beta-propeller repeat protein [Sulfidibacter corallicola]QTD51530.1 PQQ-binding-like beta-propeller repeat protein [Sulfidibacter corallicola]